MILGKCVCENMIAFESYPAHSLHHLRITENAGVVKDRRAGKWVYYSITDRELKFTKTRSFIKKSKVNRFFFCILDRDFEEFLSRFK